MFDLFRIFKGEFGLYYGKFLLPVVELVILRGVSTT